MSFEPKLVRNQGKHKTCIFCKNPIGINRLVIALDSQWCGSGKGYVRIVIHAECIPKFIEKLQSYRMTKLQTILKEIIKDTVAREL